MTASESESTDVDEVSTSSYANASSEPLTTPLAGSAPVLGGPSTSAGSPSVPTTSRKRRHDEVMDVDDQEEEEEDEEEEEEEEEEENSDDDDDDDDEGSKKQKLEEYEALD